MSSSQPSISPAYVWFDSEFTGLDTDSARLLQVAMVVTDVRLRRLAPASRDLSLYIRLDPDIPVSPWVAQNLPELLVQCRSERAVTVEEADRRLARGLDEILGPAPEQVKDRPILAGNTVHMDAGLARRYLPEFSRRLHYRLLDVSTVKILWNDWFSGPVFDKQQPGVVEQNLPQGLALPAAGKHDAYFDIHASIAELNFYQRRLVAGAGAAGA